MNRIKPIFKRGIPQEKFQKIFYPKLYSKESLKDRNSCSIKASFDYDSYVNRDLYGIKENSVNKRYIMRRMESETSNYSQSGVLTESYIGINEQRQTSSDFHKGLPPVDNKQCRLSKDNINDLAIVPYKSYSVNKSSIIDKGSLYDQYQHDQEIFTNNITEYGILDQLPANIKENQRAKIEEIEKVLKYMLEKHNPSVTNLDGTKYRKAVKQNIELFELQTLNKVFQSEDEAKSIIKENSDLQKLIDRIKENMKKKRQTISRSVRRKNPSIGEKSTFDVIKASTPFITENLEYEINPGPITRNSNVQYGNIRAALSNYPKVKTNKRTQSVNKVNGTIEMRDRLMVQHNKSTSTKIMSRLKCDFKKLMKSIDNESETMKLQTRQIHKITKELSFCPKLDAL